MSIEKVFLGSSDDSFYNYGGRCHNDKIDSVKAWLQAFRKQIEDMHIDGII